MSDRMVLTREISTPAGGRPIFSICTMVTRHPEYSEMLDSFVARGFTIEHCEYLHVDNADENRLDAFAAYNRFLIEARGDYIILVHQDVLLLQDDFHHLKTLLGVLDAKHPNWGICGNAGAEAGGQLAIRITDPHTPDHSRGGPFPAQVISLDENFIIVRREANLALSRDLSGFHWYGADLCVIADALGYGAYVIDFHLKHKSAGNPDTGFDELKRQVQAKYQRAFRPRWQHVTTGRPVYLSSSSVRTFCARVSRKVGKLAK